MTAILAQRLLTAGGIAALGFALSGCLAGTTYGTGTTPGRQTLRDIGGIVALGGNDKPPIDFSARPPIVAPPSTAALPPPQDTPQVAAGVNWPNDPDEMAKAKLATADAPIAPAWQKTAKLDPQFRLPKQGPDAKPFHQLDERADAEAAIGNPARDATAKKLFADSRRSQNGSVDANGAPVRRYLTEPPATYREPDPTAPTEIIDKPKPKRKFKWGWPWAGN